MSCAVCEPKSTTRTTSSASKAVSGIDPDMPECSTRPPGRVGVYDRVVRTPALLLPLIALTSCSQPALRASYDSDLPSERALAAARAHEDDAVTDRTLVRLLDSADPAVRLLAIRALEGRTGETLGFHYADPPEIRAVAVEAWASRVRLNGRGDGAGG